MLQLVRQTSNSPNAIIPGKTTQVFSLNKDLGVVVWVLIVVVLY